MLSLAFPSKWFSGGALAIFFPFRFLLVGSGGGFMRGDRIVYSNSEVRGSEYLSLLLHGDIGGEFYFFFYGNRRS